MGGEHDHRRPLTDCTVRSHIVVVLAPKLDLCPGVVKVQEPMLVQAFKANASVEAFDGCGLEAVLSTRQPKGGEHAKAKENDSRTHRDGDGGGKKIS